MAEERYQPLPPVARLPALLWQRIGGPGRILVVIAGLAAAVAVIVLAPRIADTKRDNEARDRREAAAVKARQIRELRALVRPRTATASSAGAVLADLERFITEDARGRPGSGRVLRTDCKPIRGGGSRFSCTAVTSDLPGGEVSREGAIGYPYRALTDGRELTWCRVAGRPGEGSLEIRKLYEVPRACGG